jgi:flagellar hook-associated protein 3 FlgL
MRITNDIIARTVFSNMDRLSNHIFQLTRRSTTGRAVERASDNPLAARLIVEYSNSIARMDQYVQNIDEGLNYLTETESLLGQVEELMMRAREITQEGVDAGAEGELDIYAEEVDNLLDDLVSYANSRYLGRYVFGGTETLDQPFTLDPTRSFVTVNTDTSGEIRIEVDEGTYQVINLSGEAVFVDEVDMFDLTIRLRDALLASDTDELLVILEDIDDAIDHILATEANLGSRISHLESLSSFLASRRFQLEDHRSRLEDADIARVMIELQEAQVVFQSASAAAVMLFNNNLMNFLY